MTYAVWVPVLLGLGMSLAAPLLPRVARPAAATIALVVLGLVVALCTVSCLLLVAGSLAVRGAMAVDDPVSPVVALLAAVAAVPLLITGARVARRQLRALRAVDRAVASSGGGAVVLTGGGAHAHAVGGLRRGRIEVGDALLAVLSPDERCAVLAHERAHLAGRHALLRATARSCAALHPGLRRLPGLVDASCERWADEAAARAVGDRGIVARALARAALAAVRSDAGREAPGTAGAAAFGLVAVTARVEALLVEPPPLRRGVPLLAAVVADLGLVAVTALHAGWDLGGLLVGSP